MTSATPAIRIACVGDSITEGVGVADAEATYPRQLLRQLAGPVAIGNFGCSGATAQAAGDLPYASTRACQAVPGFAPTLVLIMLGTNDTKPHNWVDGDRFADDLAALVERFRGLPTRPETWLLTPPAVEGENFGIRGAIIAGEVVPRVAATARRLGAGLIDVHAATLGHAEWFPDRVHPAEPGMRAIATAVAARISGRAAEGRA